MSIIEKLWKDWQKMYTILISIIVLIALAVLFRKPKTGKDGVVKYGELYSDFKTTDKELESSMESYEDQPQSTYSEPPINASKYSAPVAAQEIYQGDKEQEREKYEEFISNLYKANGYIVWEYSKESDKEDIDLIAKKDNEIVFIQCKNRINNNTKKTEEIDLKATRIDVIDYLEKYPQLQPYKYKIICIATEDMFHTSAKKYATSKSHIMELKIIPHQQV